MKNTANGKQAILKNYSCAGMGCKGSGGVTDPGSVNGSFRHCVEGHGLERIIGDI